MLRRGVFQAFAEAEYVALILNKTVAAIAAIGMFAPYMAIGSLT